MKQLSNSILVVDDNPDNCLLLQTVLEAEGYDIEIAYGGQEALAHIASKVPDLILLDVMMPGMTGLEVLQFIRQQLQLQTPIILVTAYQEQQAHQGLELGANDFILKPIDIERIMNKIQQALQVRVFASSRVS